jgi:hypothetical protein
MNQLMNLDKCKEGEYYAVKIMHPSINDYPEFVKKYTSNLQVYYKKKYSLPIRDVRTFVFEHTVPRGHYTLMSALTSVCRSYIKQEIDYRDRYVWESHIFEDRFEIVKSLNQSLKSIVRKWRKKSIEKKMCIYMCMAQNGLPRDLCNEITNKHYNG